jgi:two-component system, NarL family, nitrate/nitrite response regulator NarL
VRSVRTPRGPGANLALAARSTLRPPPTHGGQQTAGPLRTHVVSVGTAGGIRRVLEAILTATDEFSAGASFPTAAEALRAISFSGTDVAVVALALPDLCGIRCALELRIRRPEMRTILVSGSLDPALTRYAVAAGVCGWLRTPLDPGQCLATLRFVACAPLLPAPSSSSRANRETRGAVRLNEREQKVLGCLAKGRTYKEIQDDLNLSNALVKKVQHHAFVKLHANNRTEAVTKWLAGYWTHAAR